MHEELSGIRDAETPAKSPKSVPDRTAEGLLHRGTTAEQLELQIGLLTQAMTESMIFASGAFPDLAEGELPEMPNGTGHIPAPKRAMTFAAARSLQLQDAARLSFATASLVGALTRLKSQPGQRFTTRQMWIDDPDDEKESRKITTFSHTLIAPRDVIVQLDPVKEQATVDATPSETTQ